MADMAILFTAGLSDYPIGHFYLLHPEKAGTCYYQLNRLEPGTT
jgi:hypothetical protein